MGTILFARFQHFLNSPSTQISGTMNQQYTLFCSQLYHKLLSKNKKEWKTKKE